MDGAHIPCLICNFCMGKAPFLGPWDLGMEGEGQGSRHNALIMGPFVNN
jgi:hypothetical protein